MIEDFSVGLGYVKATKGMGVGLNEEGEDSYNDFFHGVFI
jgi:hypothetical protein